MALYRIEQTVAGSFKLYESGQFVAEFTRSTFRQELDKLGRGSNWVGSILRLLSKKYPLPSKKIVPPSKNQKLLRIGEDRLVDYLKSRGFRVYKYQEIDDRSIIEFLEAKGYCIEGLLSGDVYYKSCRLVVEELLK
jgi:hypothetical protein